MTAHRLSHFLYLSEAEPSSSQALDRLANTCGIELSPVLLTFLSHLTDQNRDPHGRASACEDVRDDANLPLFWRALAAHHRALACTSKEDPDAFFPQVMSIINPIYSRPAEDKQVGPTPEGCYLYYLRQRDRFRVVSASYSREARLLGAECFIKEGWFEAPAWVLDACDHCLASDYQAEAQRLMKLFVDRRPEPDCHFSRHGSAQLIKKYERLYQP